MRIHRLLALALVRAERAADQLRWRYYDSGAAICLILDRLPPDWKTRIDNDTALATIALLEAAVSRAGEHRAAFSTVEMSAFERRAAAAIGELTARQSGVPAELLGRSGPRIVVEVGADRDPLGVTRSPTASARSRSWGCEPRRTWNGATANSSWRPKACASPCEERRRRRRERRSESARSAAPRAVTREVRLPGRGLLRRLRPHRLDDSSVHPVDVRVAVDLSLEEQVLPVR
jgi:hypothetical protein